ncbi:Gx transporter family protein [Anoxynatronum buryatiense]|uniref:Gx transporter family protein n=1 Tax=Anoxynatronum buryatiense TaxID=489973 RepID=UPI0024B85EB5|nr:Gx transporter family protein [Anoxynatronum buryatiense]
MNPTKKVVYFGILTSLGLALHIIEGFIPNPFMGIVPGAKIGLANIIGLMALVLFGLRFALAVNLMRVFMAGMLTGAVTSMMYGLAGALFSTLLMWTALHFLKRFLSLVGVSVLGALGHNVAQLSVAGAMIQNIRIFVYLPFMMFASIFTGIFIGLTAYFVLQKVKYRFTNITYSLI